MAVRLERHQETALKLARWLANAAGSRARAAIPRLESDPGHAIWKRDFTGASGLFGVVLKPVAQAALAAFMDSLKLFGIGFSWGGYESLIVPAHIQRTAQPFRGRRPGRSASMPGWRMPTISSPISKQGFARMRAAQ